MKILPEDNGEIFLSQYYIEQHQRNIEFKPTLKESPLCKCLQCQDPAIILRRQQDSINSVVATTKPTKNINVIMPKPAPLPPVPPSPPLQLFCQTQPSFYYPNCPPAWYQPLITTPVLDAASSSHCGCKKNVEYHMMKRVRPVRGKPPHDVGCNATSK